MSDRTYHWGIVGLGRIARKFAEDLQRLPNARLHAVASTSHERAAAFASDFGAPHAFGSYEDMVSCPDLDVVYIATPHVLHFENAMMCLENGLPVLCEKPFAMNTFQARRMVEAARRNRVFFMEALWTRFIPAVDYALALVEQGEIGQVHTVKSDFGFNMPLDPGHRLFNKALGGGALLDIGIYPALLALLVLGKPKAEDIQASAAFGPTDVDETTVFTFKYPNQSIALGHASLTATTPIEAWIHGTLGAIYFYPRWHHAHKIRVSIYEGSNVVEREVDMPYEGWGYHYEAAHVMLCLDEGWLESDKLPLELSVELAETLDAIRERIGLAYD